MKQLHPGVIWSFRLQAYAILIFVSIFLTFFLFPIFSFFFFFSGIETISQLMTLVGYLAVFYIALILVVAELYAKAAYKNYFYELTSKVLKIESGVIWKRYSSIPYERIQNVDITRGVFARKLGFSGIMIQTAGYSGQPFAEGNIPGVDLKEAEKIRSFIMKKITKKRK